jgi:iron complex transport system substrate-binding protein
VRRLKNAVLILAALVLFVTACERSNGPRAGAQSNSSSSDNATIRVVTLAPNLAELVFAAHAGDKLVGISAYTDFPPAALDLPVVSDAFMVDQEQLSLLKPDLLLAWKNGTPLHVVDQLREAGFRVEVIKTDSLDDVAVALEKIGELTGNSKPAADAAASYRQQIQQLTDRYSGSEPIDVFYQISSRPLYTVNSTHYISEILTLCGGRNIFDDLDDLAPMVDVEAVISRGPEVMLAAFDSTQAAFDIWDRWPELAANRYGNRFFIPADEIGRATPRLVAAGEAVCEALTKARRNRQAGSRHD